jgi:hypothetical protein
MEISNKRKGSENKKTLPESGRVKANYVFPD